MPIFTKSEKHMSLTEFEKVKNVISELRHPEHGCPWDLKQTHESLLKYLIEESYEFIEATELKDPKKMEEELGDVLLQILLHARLGEEKKVFDMESISKTLKEKLIRRHPHVFENRNTSINVDEVLENWEKIKQLEKTREELEKSGHHRIKESVLHAPSLTSSVKIGKKTNELKFDWDHYSQVLYKVEEEWQELKEELPPQGGINKARAYEELGDLLFSVAQLARHLEMDPEAALRDANKKFLKRFHSMEDLIQSKNLKLENMNQEQMDVYWNEAKTLEKNAKL
jgi:MazG family protein